MKRGPIDVFSNKQLERRALVPIPADIEVPGRRKRAKMKALPGSYAAPLPVGAAPSRRPEFNTVLDVIAKPFVRDGGNDFLRHSSRGTPC